MNTPTHPTIMVNSREDDDSIGATARTAPEDGRLAAFNPRLEAAALRIG
jgi:hypothetical protein